MLGLLSLELQVYDHVPCPHAQSSSIIRHLISKTAIGSNGFEESFQTV